MQDILKVFLSVIKKLESQNIPYMIVGSVGSMVYGEPRLTHDMDLVIDILPADANKFEMLFPLAEFYCPPPEVLKAEIVSRGQFNLIHQGSGLKIDIMLRKTSEHSAEEFERRQRVPFVEGVQVYMACPEDIIIKKLDYYRQGGSEKHLRDIRGILSESAVDSEYLNTWIEKLSLSREWKKI
ncbi:MAG: DUF6036 family nucleotidyltransferase [Bdellovibrionales bacterium]